MVQVGPRVQNRLFPRQDGCRYFLDVAAQRLAVDGIPDYSLPFVGIKEAEKHKVFGHLGKRRCLLLGDELLYRLFVNETPQLFRAVENVVHKFRDAGRIEHLCANIGKFNCGRQRQHCGGQQ